MANIRELKKRIRSTKQTLKITSALKLVSGSMLAKIQVRVRNSRPYAQELENAVRIASALTYDYTHQYLQESTNKNSVILVISSERGLCGSYNSSLVRKIRDFVEAHNHQNFNFKFYGIGRKVIELMSKEINLVKKYNFERSEPSFKEIEAVGAELATQFEKGQIGRIFVAYNNFESALKYTPTIVQLLPMTFFEEHRKEALKREVGVDFKYDVSPAEILDVLIPEVYMSMLYLYQLNALTSEYSARMWAMENASKNCKEVSKKLTLKMNKQRQGAITKELIEIVSGAETMKARG